MFTLCQIVKRGVAESVPGRAFVHSRNAAFEAVSEIMLKVLIQVHQIFKLVEKVSCLFHLILLYDC